MMAVFDDRDLDASSGAILYLQQPARKNVVTVRDNGSVAARKGCRALVVGGSNATNSESALEEAVDLAQEVLDIWAVKGVFARSLAAADEDHIVWWDASDCSTLRIHSINFIAPEFEAQGVALDAAGNRVPQPSEPVQPWHPSFRYFRLGQASEDLVEAFRNYYLALESLMSSAEPVKLRPDGRPGEREWQWLDRAFATAARYVNFADYTPPGTKGDPAAEIGQQIYAFGRTGTFHAKSGALVLLPHEGATRLQLRESVTQLRRLYVDLAQAVLGFRFIGGGGLAPAGFDAMITAIAPQQMYTTDAVTSPAELDAGIQPDLLSKFEAKRQAQNDGDYRARIVATVRVDQLESPRVRQVGALLNDKIGMYEDLEAVLDLTGFDLLELVFSILGQDPAALGTRYKT